jgi:hypothetical protein
MRDATNAGTRVHHAAWRRSGVTGRAAAIRELLKRGLDAEGFAFVNRDVRSRDFGVVSAKQTSKLGNGAERHNLPKT